MLTISLTSILVLFALARLYTFYQGLTLAQSPMDSGLLRCPDKPNCICSEFPADKSHYVESLMFTALDTNSVLSAFTTLIKQSGGKIDAVNAHGLAARFTTRWMGYVDDVQIRVDVEQRRIHFRSCFQIRAQ